MSTRPQICFTFVGNVTRDSRLRRFAEAAIALGDVHIAVLSADPSAALPDTRIYPTQRSGSLRAALPGFWRTAGNILAATTPDICVAADLYSLPLAARLARKSGAKLVYDARELYRAIAALEGREVTQRFWTLLEKRYARRADAVLTVNAAIAEVLAAEYSPVHVFHNYPDRRVEKRTALLRTEFGIPENIPVLLSQGGLQKGRGALLCVRALAELPSVALVFLGDGPLAAEIESTAHELGIADRVHIKSAVPSREVLEWTASADLGLCMIENLGRSYYLSLPNKLFEYIAAGVPVLGSDFPEIGRVLRDSGTGVPVAAGDAQALAQQVTRLLDDTEYYQVLRARCREHADIFQWSREKESFLTMLDGLL
ncbi:glycosyltransferase [bacterium]|nr:glycosyltransferase [bacterium]